MTMIANTPDMIPILTGLLRSEHGNLFRFLNSADPYIARSDASLRRPLKEIISAAARHEGELMSLIDELGGIPMPPGVSPDHQYLAFLSLEFLCPRLKDAAQRAVARYQAAIDSPGNATPAVTNLLKSHLDDYQRFLDALEKTGDKR